MERIVEPRRSIRPACADRAGGGRDQRAPDTDDADRLVAAMLTAGLDRSAARWRGAVASGGDGWAMLALSDPDGVGRPATLDDYAPSGRTRRASGSCSLPVSPGSAACRPRRSRKPRRAWTSGSAPPTPGRARWTAPPARSEVGTMLLLAAIGMQTSDWSGVPPSIIRIPSRGSVRSACRARRA
ncbi:hypothetical protein AB5I41_03820 [Sphingomonas sp. MMS24-JH45]